MIGFLSSCHRFLDLFGGPKEARIDQKLSSDDVTNEKSEKVDFVHPSLAKSLLLRSYEGHDRAPMRAISEFYSDQKS